VGSGGELGQKLTWRHMGERASISKHKRVSQDLSFSGMIVSPASSWGSAYAIFVTANTSASVILNLLSYLLEPARNDVRTLGQEAGNTRLAFLFEAARHGEVRNV
jgi:hypothetical protein